MVLWVYGCEMVSLFIVDGTSTQFHVLFSLWLYHYNFLWAQYQGLNCIFSNSYIWRLMEWWIGLLHGFFLVPLHGCSAMNVKYIWLHHIRICSDQDCLYIYLFMSPTRYDNSPQSEVSSNCYVMDEMKYLFYGLITSTTSTNQFCKLIQIVLSYFQWNSFSYSKITLYEDNWCIG